MDERFRWLETRINSSLRPRNEDLKNLFLSDENRLSFHEFINNEDVKKLFVYIRPPRQITASLQPPPDLKFKSIFFLKCNAGTKLTKDNMDHEVFYMDCTENMLEHLEMTLREVYLPLLATNQPSVTGAGVSSDRLMDILHRLMASVEVSQGHKEGRIKLSLPSIEVLADAAASPNRRGAVLHVLETTVISWIKQIRGVLKHDPHSDLTLNFGQEPGPLDEVGMWEKQLARLDSINQQLDSEVAKDILHNLEQASSQYAYSFSNVRREIQQAIHEVETILTFLSTMQPLFQRLHLSRDPQAMLRLFKPLMSVLLLVWSHSAYYHQMEIFHQLLRLISNEVVHRAVAMVGDDVLREPLESYSKLKDALRVCAAFRGTYLDFKDKADDQNATNIAENAERMAFRPRGKMFSTKIYGPHAYTPRYGLRGTEGDPGALTVDEALCTDSPWPPRNAPCFDLLNNFMERCNDVLELVQTTRHFRLLAGAAEVGGAGQASLDALVKEIHQKYTATMHDFFAVVSNVLSIDGTQNFERAFFKFRTVVKGLERRLAGILWQAFSQVPTVEAQLRLLEVFEGVSSRELVQAHLKDKDKQLVTAFTNELTQVRDMFDTYRRAPPPHYNLPPIISKLMWINALQRRIQKPMEKLRHVSPHSLEGDEGWHMRDMYSELVKELEEYAGKIIMEWQKNITAELTLRLKQPLLVADEYDEDMDVRPQVVHVNLDPQLLLLLREIKYLSQEPFNVHLPEAAKDLLRNTNSFELSVTATRLETIVNKYNAIMRTLTPFEKPLFERKLTKIDTLFDQGLHQYTWKMRESADFIETAMSLVCLDVHQNLDIVQTNCHEIADITISWSSGTLDVFQARDQHVSHSMEALLTWQQTLTEELESTVVPLGQKIHGLVQVSFEAVQISQASPAWQDYIDYIDAIVLDGLKQTTLVSLKSMLNTLVQANLAEIHENESAVPILTIRLELIDNAVAFRPPLDQSTSVVSVQELVARWLEGYLARGRLVKMLGPKGTYQDYIAADEEVKQLLSNINKVVDENSEECKKLLSAFTDYSFLWVQDVNQTFEDFLRGNVSPNPLRSPVRSGAAEVRHQALERVSEASRSSSRSSLDSAGLAGVMGLGERTFLTPKGAQDDVKGAMPSLDEFDSEIDIYRSARDEIQSLQDFHDVGWLRVDLQPIKQVLTTYASKWMWTFTKHLSDRVTDMLQQLDGFLKRIEPEIESITGEERDTASFMKMMRLFNEVSAQQSEMDGKFAAMHRTVLLLKKYGQKLPQKTQHLFNAAPGRWSSLKTKVSLAKQRLGPRIQEESASISQDLHNFAGRVKEFQAQLEESEIYQRDCSLSAAWTAIDDFSRQLTVLEGEAQDLIELQELLEANIVNFSILPQCRHELNNLKQVWETVRVIEEQQTEWKRHRWQKMNTKFLREETGKQLDIVRALPEDVFTWDVYMGLHESITTIQACLPLIDDLSNPAMRTRHWKQLVRVTGGVFTIDNDTLKRMTLGELLSLGLQKHVDDVRAIVQRAVKDLSIEMSLKTYEEVWLSKIFEVRPHVRSRIAGGEGQDGQSDSQSEGGLSQQQSSTQPSRGGPHRTTSRVSNQSSTGRAKRNSIVSLPASLLNIGENELPKKDSGPLFLLTNTDAIFEELESHQVALQAMQSNSAAGSFLDEVLKWQKRLQTIEAVMAVWLEVQEKWAELEDVYSGSDIKTVLAHDANRFALVNKDFRLLMRATEKNPNVLQCCSRRHILGILEQMNRSLESCRRSLLHHLERRRQLFPRFYFLSMEDVLHIVCNGYDLSQVNMYVSKLLEQVGCLLYEEDQHGDKNVFTLTGVRSALGETLPFLQTVTCEGQIEAWLVGFLGALKGALQFQLATALGFEKPLRLVRRIQSAGARRVELPVKGSTLKLKDKGSRQASRGASRVASRQGKEPGQGDVLTEEGEPADPESRSWTLEHASEVVYLATQVRLTSQVQEALDAIEGGDRDSLHDAVRKIDESIRATTVLLKGVEGEREAKERKLRTASQAAATPADAELLQDEMSESAGRKSMISQSKKGSNLDVRTEGNKTPTVDEEGMSRGPVDADSSMETTAEPVDTMTISAPPVPQAKKTEAAEAEEAEEAAALAAGKMKLMLFPSQVQKLTNLLALLSHQRDLAQRLLDMKQTSPGASFDWKCQLRYTFHPDTKTLSVQCMDALFDYGFEYMGASMREVITPLTERVFVTLTQAVKSHMGALCVGLMESGKMEVVQELSRSLGKALYSFNCTRATDYFQLQDIFRGLASTGCYVAFNNMNTIAPAVLSVFAQLMTTVMEAMRAGKASVHLQHDDIQLSLQGACFGLMDSAVAVQARDPEKQLLYTSAVARLPGDVLSQFRVVSVSRPDLRLAIEVMLFSQGFENGRELARKTADLQAMCCKMFGANLQPSDLVELGVDRSARVHGWSLQTLKNVSVEAGAHLERLSAELEDQAESAPSITGAEKHETEDREKDVDTSLESGAVRMRLEDKALVTSLRDTFLPRMQSRDASVFATLCSDLWPGVDVPMVFGGDEESAHLKPAESLQTVRSELRIKTALSHESGKSIKESVNLNTPVVALAQAHGRFSVAAGDQGRQVLEDIADAIAVATSDLGLLPGTAFQARVAQLSQLNAAHQSVFVVGPPGCGKSECIKTFAVAERERGKVISVQSVFTKAVESDELMGFYHPKTKEWKEGLLTSLLRKFCVQPVSMNYDFSAKPTMKIMQLDGETDPFQLELLQCVLRNSGSVVLANNERISLPDTLRFFWELESLEHLSPSLLSSVGVLVMTPSDVGWKLMILQWLEARPESEKDLLTSFCNDYLPKVVEHITECTLPPMFGKKAKGTPQYRTVITQPIENMVRSFCHLMETLTSPYPELTDLEYERYFNFAALWAFGGTLEQQFRDNFSQWWRQQFHQHIDFPEEGQVFDYVVDAETHEFVRWADQVPSYTGTPHSGIPNDAFVHTVLTEQVLYLLGLLTDAGRSVMLVGERGCGKTAIVNDRIRTVCSGEVAEVHSLLIYANRFTNARLLFDRLDERLEWKHGRTYVPRGNKRLLCLVDDLNLSKVDKFGFQTAAELVREHLDDGGFYSPLDHTWHYVKNVTYVTTVNPHTTAAVPALSQRLLRHFAIFGCPYPSETELQTVFTTLLSTHFLTPESSSAAIALHSSAHDDKAVKAQRLAEEQLRQLLEVVVGVTVELQGRLRSMFLPTAQRCHYLFTLRDLATIFKNVCLSLQPGCSKRNLLLLWQHECSWIYSRRMVNDVDMRRYRQAFITAVKKRFTNEEHIQLLISPKRTLLSNLIEQDSGIVTAGMIDTRHSAAVTEEDARTDLYKPVPDIGAVQELLEKGVEEFNKIHPKIRVALYKSVIEQVCRLARTIASPHETANMVLVSEGCPSRVTTLALLAAHLCGYTVFHITPISHTASLEQRMEQFKNDLVTGYTRAGSKGEKILMLLHEEELVDEDFLVYLIEFIVAGAITHLFSQEEQTTIINSIRTEVTQAGLTYTRDVAWNFFLKTVQQNFRVCLLVGSTTVSFQRRCREYPSFTGNVSFVWFLHWTKTQLVEHALYHLKDVSWLSDVQRENIAHMLASMHMVLRQQDGGEKDSGEYGHVTNTTYEKFVEKFISLMRVRYEEVGSTQLAVTRTLQQIRKENEVAVKLKKQLEHELVVLEERKAGTIRILSQIGQDTAITEQQIKVVRNQLDKIQKLKKLLPEYQVAHERAVYKAIAIVADTKQIVRQIDHDRLAELRAMSKPIVDVEDLMAAIIMILKSPSADLTWQKGAKRQMANLERFSEELNSFDDQTLPEATLNLVEPYLKKPSFDPDNMERKTGNSACGSLCKWVRGVVRYHRTMISKVKPLHKKVEETTQQVDSAEHKMNTLETKRTALETRLADLSKGFEEATIDKNEQEEKTLKMRKMLDTAAQLRKVLRGERRRCQQIFDSYDRRLVSIPGGCAMASALATYLGPYHHNFRRVMLTVHWPNCLRERGVPLVIDSIDGLKGRVIDWSIGFLKTASGASSVYDVDYAVVLQEESKEDLTDRQQRTGTGTYTPMQTNRTEGDEDADDEGEEGKSFRSRSQAKSDVPSQQEGRSETGARSAAGTQDGEQAREEAKSRADSQGAKSRTGSRAESQGGRSNQGQGSTAGQEAKVTAKDGEAPETDRGGDEDQEAEDDDDFGEEKKDAEKSDTEKETASATFQLGKIAEEGTEMDDDDMTQFTETTAPVLTSSQYNRYIRSLIKLLIGETTLNDWIRKDFGPRQVENAAILMSSWQRPPMLIDPNRDGALWLEHLCRFLNSRKLISLDMNNRWTDPQVLMTLEKAVTRGRPVLLYNCGEHIDNIITPLIHHRNTASGEKDDSPRMTLFCGRRILCHPNFRFYLSTGLAKPTFDPVVSSSTTLVNFGVSHDTLIEDLLTRSFARIRPDLYKERMHGLRNLQLLRDTLLQLSETVKDRVLAAGHEAMLSSSKSLQFITDLTTAKLKMAKKLSEIQALLEDLDLLKDELFPLARRAAMLYAVLRSLVAVRPEYQFPLKYFLQLFDEAVGGEFPAEYNQLANTGEDAVDDDDTTTDKDKRPHHASMVSMVSGTEKNTATGGKASTGQGGDEPSQPDGETTTSKPIDQMDGTEAAESLSSTAARKLVAGTESEELPPLELPVTVELPSAGVEYSSFSVNKVKQLMDNVTSLFYQRVRQSLYEEDILLFSTLLCLNIQSERAESFSSEEMSLLLQGNPGLGMQLTLADFDCKAAAPAWLPREKWDDILALSVLPGPLDSLCVGMAVHGEEWREWYQSDQPEREPLPQGPPTPSQRERELKEKTSTKEGGPARGVDHGIRRNSPDLGSLSDFHQLLILRMLRPDRLPTALAHYVTRHLTSNLPFDPGFSLADTLLDARDMLGILLLLPPSPRDPEVHPVTRLKLTQPVLVDLMELAKEYQVGLERVKLGEGQDYLVDEALDAAEKKDGWVVIEDLHLASPALLDSLHQRLNRLYNGRAVLSQEKRDSSRLCVWLTCEAGAGLPSSLVQRLHKVAWSHLAAANYVTADDATDATEKPPVLMVEPDRYFKTAIISTLRQIPDTVWEDMGEDVHMSRALLFGAVVVQGALVARQLFGSAGLTQWYPFSGVQVQAAADMIVSKMLRPSDGSEPSLEDLSHGLSELLYGVVVLEETDRDYIRTLTREVLHSVFNDPAGEIRLGRALIPTPQASIEPMDYADWFDRTAEDMMTLNALQLHPSIERTVNEAMATEFVRSLDRMFETQNLEAGELLRTEPDAVDIRKLRSALDICMEELPPLLEIGPAPQLTQQQFDFPYHRPSFVSSLSLASSQMPETIGFVLLQECLWLNVVLCQARQHVSVLGERLLGGAEALPRALLPAVLALQEELVPLSWQHPHCQPGTHSLLSWLQDLKQRYQQLRGWVRSGMVPKFTAEGGATTANPTIARGQLTSVWLGGLVNPGALLVAMRQEKAILSGCSIEEVQFQCFIVGKKQNNDLDLESGDLYLTDLYLQGAAWDHEENTLVEPESGLLHIPCMHLKLEATSKPVPVVTSDERSHGDLAANLGQDHVYSCPVYMNASRQVLVTSLPLSCSRPAEHWTLARAAILLDQGLPPDASKKSRSYQLLQHVTAPPMAAEEEEFEEEETEEEQLSGELVVEGLEAASVSEQSQMSYKPMTPKAPPLPPELSMVRERPMGSKEGSPLPTPPPAPAPAQYDSQPPSVRGSRPPSNRSAAAAPVGRESPGAASITGQDQLARDLVQPSTGVHTQHSREHTQAESFPHRPPAGNESDRSGASRGEEDLDGPADRQSESARGADKDSGTPPPANVSGSKASLTRQTSRDSQRKAQGTSQQSLGGQQRGSRVSLGGRSEPQDKQRASRVSLKGAESQEKVGASRTSLGRRTSDSREKRASQVSLRGIASREKQQEEEAAGEGSERKRHTSVSSNVSRQSGGGGGGGGAGGGAGPTTEIIVEHELEDERGQSEEGTSGQHKD